MSLKIVSVLLNVREFAYYFVLLNPQFLVAVHTALLAKQNYFGFLRWWACGSHALKVRQTAHKVHLVSSSKLPRRFSLSGSTLK